MAPKDEDRAAILARRQRFVTAALAGITTSTLATACPCLDVEPPPDETDSETDDETDHATAAEHDGTAGSSGSSGSGGNASSGSSSGGGATGPATTDGSGTASEG
ncbi:MAG: hypothetical protein AAF799_43845 [Myxococcota bacterium]